METETRLTPGVEGGDKNHIPEASFAIAKANSEEPNRTDTLPSQREARPPINTRVPPCTFPIEGFNQRVPTATISTDTGDSDHAVPSNESFSEKLPGFKKDSQHTADP